MILYLYGADTYRRQNTLQEKILKPYQKKHPQGVVENFFLSEKGSLERLERFISSQSLFDPVKLALVFEPEAAEEKALSGLLKNSTEDAQTTVVVLAGKKLAKGFGFLLKEPVKAWEFAPLKAGEFLVFIKAESQKRGLSLKPEQIQDLAGSFSGDSWGLVNELEKMSLGAKSEVRDQRPEFFELIKLFAYRRELRSRMRALYYLLADNDGAMVFNMLSAFASGEAKVKMADYDAMVKSGKLEYEEALLAVAMSA